MPQTDIFQDLNEYRLAWVDTDSGQPGKGTFLFNTLAEAKATIEAVRKQFPAYHVWLEDRECNKIKI